MKHYNFNKAILRRHRRQAIAEAVTWIGGIVAFIAIAWMMVWFGYSLFC
jgi:uncharacterized membrane protein AbrB (regulator of aidB expression)